MPVAQPADQSRTQPLRPLLSDETRIVMPPGGLRPAPIRGSLGVEMVWIPAGAFWMGSPRDEAGRHGGEVRHEVSLSAPFWLGTSEVSQALWERVMGDNPSTRTYQGVSLIGERLPVHTVRWTDAIRFANRLSAAEGLRPAYRLHGKQVTWDRSSDGYRLPTEAEWEFAARSGTYDAFSGTDSPEDVCRFANVATPSGQVMFSWKDPPFPCEDGVSGLAPVGSFSANAWGLHDMTGNIWEWVWDWEGPYPSQDVTDPTGPETGTARLKRGGSWMHRWRSARVADRSRDNPEGRYHYVGLRLARSTQSGGATAAGGPGSTAR